MSPTFEQVPVAGHLITNCRMPDVRQLLREAIAGDRPAQRLATMNLDFYRLASEDDAFRQNLATASERFADGWPVLALAEQCGHTLPERVTGSDLTPLICQWASEEGWKLGFIGATDSVREILAKRVPERYGDILAGHWNPFYGDKCLDDPELCTEIADSGAQILLVALGSPKQEYWLEHNLERSGARAGMGVGASLDFLAGQTRRAPKIFQKLNLEFLYRFCQEPRRLGKRYIADYVFYRKLRRQLKHDLKKQSTAKS